MAFGTGEHETTKMCLDLLGEIDVSGKTVIDVGTGSGILGIASILSDAKSAYMCDIDSTAIDTAKENARLNNVSDRCEIERADLLGKSKASGCGNRPSARPRGRSRICRPRRCGLRC